MPRSVWKPLFCNPVILQDFLLSFRKKKAFVIYSKNSVIIPAFVGYVFSIYDGRKFVNIQVYNHMIGYKFSRYINTKKTV